MSSILDPEYHQKRNDNGFGFNYYNEWVDAYMKADIKDIEQYMQTCRTSDYFTACRMLKERGGKEDYDLLEKQLGNSDRFKYRCALDYILYFNTGKARHAHRVDEMLASDDVAELRRATEMIAKHELALDSDKVCRVYEKHLSDMHCACALKYTQEFDSLFERIVVLFKRAEKKQKECISKLLFDLSNTERFETIFDILANDSYHKVRFVAVRLAIKHEKYELLSRFCREKDGHIRKLATRFVR